jgi:uncharacterized RDD family membrane protein YckC
MDPYNTADALNPRPQQPVAPQPPPATSNASANPYAAPGARVAQPMDTGGEFNKASRGTRLGAVLIDGFTMMLFLVPAIMSVFASIRSGGTVDYASLGGLAVLGGVAFLGLLGFNMYLVYSNGQTIGKKLLGIKIVRTDGSRASLKRVFFLRWCVPGLIGQIPFLGPFFGLIDPLFIFGDEKRCIHDLIADTIVVDA